MYRELVARLTPGGTRGLSYGYLGAFGVGALGDVFAGTHFAFASVGVSFESMAVVRGSPALAASSSRGEEVSRRPPIVRRTRGSLYSIITVNARTLTVKLL